MQGSLKKRGKFWYLTVDMGKEEVGVDENGKPIYKRIQKKINTKSEKKPDAQKVQVEILNQLKNNTFVNPEKSKLSKGFYVVIVIATMIMLFVGMMENLLLQTISVRSSKEC